MKTRALILAAGQGTRLRPYTNDRPKCLVKLLGKSLLERQVEILNSCGITDIHVATGFNGHQISELGFNTTCNPRYAQTNMVETLFCARKFIEKDGDLIISYGDIVYEKNNLEKVLSCQAEIALMIDLKWKSLWEVRTDNPLDDAETLLMDRNGYIREIGKKTNNYKNIEGQYTGLIKIRHDKIKEFINFYDKLDQTKLYDGKDFYNLYMTSFLQELIDNSWKVKAVVVNNGWLEIDTVSDLDAYEKLHKEGRLEKFYKEEG